MIFTLDWFTWTQNSSQDSCSLIYNYRSLLTLKKQKLSLTVYALRLEILFGMKVFSLYAVPDSFPKPHTRGWGHSACVLFQRRRYRYWCFTFFTTCFILYRRLISRPSVTSFVLSLGGMIPIRSLIIIESYIFKLLYLGYDWMFSFVRGGTYILEREESIPMATQPVSVHLVLDSIQMSWLMVVKWYLEKANF